MTSTEPTGDQYSVASSVAIAVLLFVTLVAAAGTVGLLWAITPVEEPGAPNANVVAEQDTSTLTVDGERIEVTRVTFRHDGGDSIDADALSVRVETENRTLGGLDADGRVVTFETATDAVEYGDAVSVVAAARLDEGDEPGVALDVESVDGDRRLTDGNGTVVELEPGDRITLIWSSDGRASTIRSVTVEGDGRTATGSR